MKWERKKAPSTSSHSPSIPHRMFPISWLSNFKQKNGCYEPKSTKAKQKGQEDMPSFCSSLQNRGQEGRFYCGDDDSYWRLSFGDERKKSLVGPNSVSCASDDDEHGVPVSISRSSKSDSGKREETWNYNEMVTRKFQRKVGISQQNDAFGRKEANDAAQAKLPRRKSVKDQKSRRSKGRTSGENRAERVPVKAEQRTSKTAEKVLFEVQPEKTIHSRGGLWQSRASDSRKQRIFSFPNSNIRTVEEDFILETLNLEKTDVLSEEEEEEEEGGGGGGEEEEGMNLQWKKLEDMKIKEMMLKNEQQRRSVYVERNCQKKRRKQTSRTKVCSPRTATKIECKIRAVEDMKKANMKKKKKKERTLEDTTAFDSYAVVKSSFNPQKDFRDSMIEMIVEKGIERPEELEELLACYLTLNCDKYHDLIIEVFRQVWFELNQVYLGPDVENDHRCDNYLLFSR